MKLAFLSVFVLLASQVEAQVAAIDADAIVETAYGKIQGTTTTATNQKTIYSFKSIPFAKLPRRFDPAVALNVAEDSWGDEIRDGTKNAPSCAQHGTFLSQPSEDCLYLNVYTPIKPGSSDIKLPVMVYIFGGGHMLGDSVVYAPNRLMAHNDVVIVTINYRLLAFGFLSTGDDVVPGNNGLKDQVMALRWVQENIDRFNGDKDHVTLFGESAGSADTIAHVLSPISAGAGLFHKAIAQSGTAITAWARESEPLKAAQRLADSLGCTYTNNAEMVECLRGIEWEVLAKECRDYFTSQTGQLIVDFGNLAMIVEHEHDGAFITQDPLEILKNGTFPQIPVMLGANQHEGSAILASAYVGTLEPSGNLDDPSYVRHELIPQFLNAVELSDELIGGPLSQTLQDYYFAPEARRDNFTEITAGLVDILSVMLFKAPILLTADYLSQHLNPVYLYSFEYEGPYSLWLLLFNVLGAIGGTEPPPIEHGVMHADDLLYLWSFPFVITGKDRQFSEMVCKMWTDFAVTSNPTPGNEWPEWLKYSTADPNYYKLDFPPEQMSNYVSNWRVSINDQTETA